jgi:tRNA wybutosine-synthesizing protein 1
MRSIKRSPLGSIHRPLPFVDSFFLDRYALKLAAECKNRGVACELIDLATYDPEDLAGESAVCVFILSTYEGGAPPASAAWFHKWLDETRNDFREDKRLLRDLKYTVFGLANSL